MKKSLIITLGLLLVLTLGSCSRRITDFTVISTKNVPIGEGVSTDFQKGTKRVKGVDVAHSVLYIPFGYPNMKEAIDKAIEQIPGAIGLVDGVVKYSWWTCFVYGQSKYIIEGTPLFPTGYNYEDDVNGYPSGYKNINNRYNNSNYNQQSQNRNYGAPTPQAPAPTPKNTYLFYHEVTDGETLASIARQYNVTIGDIIKWNKLSGSSIQKGQRLTIRITE